MKYEYNFRLEKDNAMADNSSNAGMKCSFHRTVDECRTISNRNGFDGENVVLVDQCDHDVTPYLQRIQLHTKNKELNEISEKDLILNRGISFLDGANPISRANITVCPYHRFKLGIGYRVMSKKCSHPNHEGKQKGDRRINKCMSENIRFAYRAAVPIGHMICRSCRNDSQITGPSRLPPEETSDLFNDSQFDTSIFESTMETTNSDSDFEVTITENDIDVTSRIKDAANACFQGLANSLNETVTEQSFVSTGDYSMCDSSTKNSLKAALRERVMISAKALAPNHYEELVDDFIRTEYLNNSEDHGEESWVRAFSELLPTLNTSEKIMILSIFAYSDTKKHLVTKLNCSERIIRAARKHAREVGAAKTYKAERVVRHRLSQEKIEHFVDFLFDTQLQTMSWGNMKLKFSDSHAEEIAPVLRKNIPSHIIHLYYKYCKAEMPENFKPLSFTTLWKILHELPAKTKKSLSGLDDIMAEGLSGFATLGKLIDDLEKNGISVESCRNYRNQLDKGKQYLKGQYAINVSVENSRCADHCRTFALSDPKDKNLQEICDHDHDRICEQCESLKTLLEKLDIEIESLCDESKSKELQYDLSVGREQVDEWKKHILRSAQQQKGKDDILKSLSASKALLIIDWGMKCLPQEYLEKSKNWYGKKGMSWAFACLIVKESEKLKKFTYTVCVEKCIQDWWSNCAVFDAVLQKIRTDHPTITNIIDKHDNAACYHNAYYWLAKKEIADINELKLDMTIMNEPCMGKDECDRMISKCRNHLRYYVNAGNKVTSATDMRNGLIWMDGVKGVSVSAITVDSTNIPGKSFPFNIPDVTKMFFLEYEKEHMVVRRAYNIGSGRIIKYPNKKIYNNNFQFLHPFSSNPQNSEPGTVKSSIPMASEQQHWNCPSSGCQRTFTSIAALRRHNFELCTYEVKRTSMDNVKRVYANKLEVLDESSVKLTRQGEDQLHSGCTLYKMGWALKNRKQTKRFSKPMLDWVKEYFVLGEKDNGKKSQEKS